MSTQINNIPENGTILTGVTSNIIIHAGNTRNSKFHAPKDYFAQKLTRTRTNADQRTNIAMSVPLKQGSYS